MSQVVFTVDRQWPLNGPMVSRLTVIFVCERGVCMDIPENATPEQVAQALRSLADLVAPPK